MKKHLLNKHPKDFVKYKTPSKLVKGGKNKSKKWNEMHPLAITKYLSGHQGYRKRDPLQMKFIGDLVIYNIMKGYEVFSSIKLP
jgi:hypothetical protein